MKLVPPTFRVIHFPVVRTFDADVEVDGELVDLDEERDCFWDDGGWGSADDATASTAAPELIPPVDGRKEEAGNDSIRG